MGKNGVSTFSMLFSYFRTSEHYIDGFTCWFSGERSLPFGQIVVVSHFGFEGDTIALIVPVPGHCLPFTRQPYFIN